MNEIKAPEPQVWNNTAIFLAGSIEMGTAEHWQTKIASTLQDYDVTLLNPRRDDWDASWEQTITNPQFKQQVQWELTGLKQSDIVIFYFDPATKSPITLLELGLCACKSNVVVCCPDGFWRKGNIEIVCDLYNITLVQSFDDLVKNLKKMLTQT